jgi:spore germination protein
VLREIKSDAKWDASQYTEKSKIDVTINVTGRINVYPDWVDSNNPDDIKRLEKNIEAEFTKKVKKLLADLQKVKSDPIGIGDITRAQDRKWSEKEFEKIYPNLTFNVKTNVNIRSSRLIN